MSPAPSAIERVGACRGPSQESQVMNAEFLGPGPDQPKYHVSAQSLAHFEEHGFVILHDVLTLRELAEMARRIDGILDGTYPVDRNAFKVGNASSGGKEDKGRL